MKSRRQVKAMYGGDTYTALNLENGSSIGSIKSISSDNELPNIAGHEDAVAIGKGCKALNKRSVAMQNQNWSPGHTAFTIGQLNKNWANGSFMFGNGNIGGDPKYEDEAKTIPKAASDPGSQYSLIGGLENQHRGQHSITIGRRNIVDSSAGTGVTDSTIVIGRFNNVDNTISSAILGESNEVDSYNNVFLLGRGLKSTRSNQTLIGSYNAIEDNDNLIFAVGNGANGNDRKNVFEVTDDGIARAYGTPEGDLDVIRIKELNKITKIIAGGDLEGLFDSKSGAYRGSIISGLSNTNMVTDGNGVTYGTYGSAIFGMYNHNKYNYSIIAGSKNHNDTDVQSESVAMFGYQNTNSGGSSIVAGIGNINAGPSSAVFGNNNDNEVESALVCGSFSTKNTDSLFVVGNGTSSSAPLDAFKIKKEDNSAVFKGTITSPTITQINEKITSLETKASGIPDVINGTLDVTVKSLKSKGNAEILGELSMLNSAGAGGEINGVGRIEFQSPCDSSSQGIRFPMKAANSGLQTYLTLGQVTNNLKKLSLRYVDDLGRNRVKTISTSETLYDGNLPISSYEGYVYTRSTNDNGETKYFKSNIEITEEEYENAWKNPKVTYINLDSRGAELLGKKIKVYFDAGDDVYREMSARFSDFGKTLGWNSASLYSEDWFLVMISNVMIHYTHDEELGTNSLGFEAYSQQSGEGYTVWKDFAINIRQIVIEE